MALEFKNMNDLVEYLGRLEERINDLEEENRQLRVDAIARVNTDRNATANYLQRLLPQTNLLSPSFLKRSFAVWGHFFVANLIIGTIIAIGYFCTISLLFGALLQSVKTQ